jgi:cytochrome b561
MAINASAPPGAVARLRMRRASGGRPWQTDLFGAALPISQVQTPSWQELSEETRGTLTNLMVLLILDHARASKADAGTEVGGDF